jgi:benzoyl-CoA reductase/2-hydroxyglutaryl-CoA dehydratase subunit BcrC/BadD/HgdB
MLDFLRLCGFDADEASTELPRIIRTFGKLGINAEDVGRAKMRLTQYYSVDLLGIRKIIRLCVLEVVNSILAREEGKKKVLFGLMAPGFETIGSVITTRSKEIYSAHQSWAFLVVIGCIFDKLPPVLEAAERSWLKAGTVSHCSNVKTFLALFAADIMPVPDLMVSAGYTCEMAPKTLDLLHEIYGIPVCCVDSCQDREYSNYSDESRRTVALAAKSFKKLVKRIQTIVGFEITDEMFLQVLDSRSKYNAALGKLRTIVENNDPVPLSSTNEVLFLALNSLTLNLDGLKEATEIVNLLREELQERVNRGQGAVKKGAPRILAILPAHHADPRLERLVEECGMALVATDPGFSASYTSLTGDLYEKMSLHLMQSLATSLPKRISLIVDGCKKLGIDGVLNRYHVGCRSVAGDAMTIAEAIGKQLNIPVLTMAWENFDTRVYDEELYRKKLEVFKIMVDNHKIAEHR